MYRGTGYPLFYTSPRQSAATPALVNQSHTHHLGCQHLTAVILLVPLSGWLSLCFLLGGTALHLWESYATTAFTHFQLLHSHVLLFVPGSPMHSLGRLGFAISFSWHSKSSRCQKDTR
ncbi:uncharacterized protein LY79DRAFT_188707 [Colletotrichum navitas]|uniref:Uncharacterized protein n=1 Tax=Colletotrichum navitas TaxID=681940 RepID=A0AAD8Q0C3_9PEZI|nr:uncharacterized protein LY79DRAFT_188707 [Colletotrichum navitas]KAK1593139.1 hypothetical protein LY79DRAFT_188707 [Colletotrichum navitas]